MAYEIEQITNKIILRELYQNGHPNKAVLAGLRNAATMTSQRAQIVWPLLMPYLNDQQLSRDGTPTYAETAIYTADSMQFTNRERRPASTVPLVGIRRMAANFSVR
ncbi:hypothetical protein [Levilactobacillus brevis]|uniref:hypothetical protein n=1 Tax=Levilactobacillus brevis TaxID=1580 RepID=UPI00288AF6E8|nr:hypothetical protein [Levilactobacillus brevis]